MVLKSMTGFGCGDASARGVRIGVEVSSVNRKQFDVRVSLPKGMQILEPQVAEHVHRRVSRGSVTCAVTMHMSGAARRACVTIDADLAALYVRDLRRIARSLGMGADASIDTLVRLPDVIRSDSVQGSPETVWPVLEKALDRAIDGMLAMREREGRTIGRDLRRRFASLRRMAAALRRAAPSVSAGYRKTLLRRLQNAGLGDVSKDQAVAREIALFADKCDVSEELVRLESHFKQADRLLSSDEPVGRAMDFLCQEMFREINTTGSKANDAAMARVVIDFKAELEAVREQVQNVE
jgi:uncharacterized protein (TIGR00255 family)